MLIMTSLIRVGQSKFVMVQIDEDSNERIMNCIQTLSELEVQPAVHEIFLRDTKAAFSKMLGAQEVYLPFMWWMSGVLIDATETCSGEKGGGDDQGCCRAGR
jgi:vesicle coat complex subunit